MGTLSRGVLYYLYWTMEYIEVPNAKNTVSMIRKEVLCIPIPSNTIHRCTAIMHKRNLDLRNCIQLIT